MHISVSSSRLSATTTWRRVVEVALGLLAVAANDSFSQSTVRCNGSMSIHVPETIFDRARRSRWGFVSRVEA